MLRSIATTNKIFSKQKMESIKDHPDFHQYDFCGHGTKSLFNSLKHLRQHRNKLQDNFNEFVCHGNVPDIYKCTHCNFETNLKVSLRHHSNLNHKNLESQNHLENVLRQCGYCDFQTYSMLLLLKHCFQCDKRENLERDKYYKITKWLECGQCSFKTKYKQSFQRHMKQHGAKIHTDSANIVRYHCDKCDFNSKWKNNLKKHLTSIHTDPANIVWYHCDRCQHKAKRKHDLQKHIRVIHTDFANIVWYHCDKCEYKSKQKVQLKRHITNIHTDSANIVWYRCDRCEYKAKEKCNLQRHIVNIHTDSANILWYHCDKCQHKTKRKYDLQKHIRINHTDSANVVWYNCDKCRFKTRYKKALKRHTAHI